MSAKRWALGCLGIPTLLVGSCAGKMEWDRRMYDLPGKVLASDSAPTQRLTSAMDVARTLDTYVQPRFEILRDKNFGAFRIVYRRHAGLVQLKVDSDREKELIANVNAAKRDYVICLLHTPCEARPDEYRRPIEVLYLNQDALVWDGDYPLYDEQAKQKVKERGLELLAVEHRAREAESALCKGQERQAKAGDWDILMRPVLATQQSCLGCHKEAARGSTLGAMVYAVRRTPRGEKAAPRVALGPAALTQH